MRTFARIIATLLATFLVAGIFVGNSQSASAGTPKRYTAMRYALKQAGKPYHYGGTGPSSFDCSGLVIKAYAAAGIKLPRTANSQYHSGLAQHISASTAKWGDLVFWTSGGTAYHVEFMTTRAHLSFGAHHSGTRISYRGFSGTVHYVHIRGAA